VPIGEAGPAEDVVDQRVADPVQRRVYEPQGAAARPDQRQHIAQVVGADVPPELLVRRPRQPVDPAHSGDGGGDGGIGGR
jgi:hypothetical protein